MSRCGTIDDAGFTADLAAIAANRYPHLQLVKLPHNWYAPATNGIIQSVQGGAGSNVNPGGTPPQTVTLPNTSNGNKILVYVNIGTGTNSATATGMTVTDSQGNTYTIESQFNCTDFNEQTIGMFLSSPISGGTVTVSANYSGTATTPKIITIYAFEIGGITGVRGTANTNGGTSCGAVTSQVGDLAFSFGSFGQANGNPASAFTTNSGWTQQQLGPYASTVPSNTLPSAVAYSLLVSTAGSITNTIDTSPAQIVHPSGCMIVLEGNFVPSVGGGNPAPITSMQLNGPSNFLVLLSEAIDEQGNYCESSLIGQQASAGWVRLNQQGPWFPLSFISPLTAGYETATNNLALNPLLGGGFSSVEALFNVLEWQPYYPVFYGASGPPTTQPTYLLALVGINFGAGATIGNGDGSTFAIPSAAGPIEREKAACLL